MKKIGGFPAVGILSISSRRHTIRLYCPYHTDPFYSPTALLLACRVSWTVSVGVLNFWIVGIPSPKYHGIQYCGILAGLWRHHRSSHGSAYVHMAAKSLLAKPQSILSEYRNTDWLGIPQSKHGIYQLHQSNAVPLCSKNIAVKCVRPQLMLPREFK